MFNFTSLLGARSSSTASQSILEFDGGAKVLVNVGWDASFDVEKLRELERQLPTISCILLTHATTAHLGAFAHCSKHFPQFARIPVFATDAVISLGSTLLQDIYASTPLACTTIPKATLEEVAFSSTATHNDTNLKILLQRPTASEITEYFSRIEPLKYFQPRDISSSQTGTLSHPITITAYSAGHSSGGTIWHIKHRSESVVFAEAWNQLKDRVVGNAAWLDNVGEEVIDGLRRPTALVSSTRGSLRNAPEGGLNARDDALLQQLKAAVGKGGSVILPTDSSARILELAYVLDANREQIKDASICIATSSCISTMQFARNVLDVNLNFEDNFRLVETKSGLDDWLSESGPKILLASDVTMEWGFARDAVLKWAEDDSNLIILTEPTSPATKAELPTLQQHFWSLYQQKSENGGSASIRIPFTEPLDDQDQPLYQAYLARQRQMQNPARSRAQHLEAGTAVPGDEESWASSSEESDEEAGLQGKSLIPSQMLQKYTKRTVKEEEDEGVNVLLKGKDVFDWDVRGKTGKNSRFPFRKKLRTKDTFDDEYGDFIDYNLFLKAEQRTQAPIETQSKAAEAAEAAEKGSTAGEKDTLGRDESLRPLAKGNELKNGEHKKEPESLGPQKLIITEQEVQFNIRVGFVDFSGRHDKQSFKMLLPKIRPSKMILIGGDEAETQEIAAECRALLGSAGPDAMEDKSSKTKKTAEVLTPRIGETVDASSDSTARDVRISEELYRSLQWHNIRKGLRVAKIAGQLKTDPDGGLPILVKPSRTSAVAAKTQTLMIGDVRLADLRKSLEAAGYSAEYRGEGTMVVGGHVVVRKRPGKIEVEGTALSGSAGGMQTFVEVKRKVYDFLAVL